MPKKSKRNIKALLAKRAELQSLNQKSALSIPGAPSASRPATAELPEPLPPTALLPDTSTRTEMRRSLISTVIIALLLAAVVISDRQSPYLNQLGDQIYDLSRLGE